MSRKLGYLLFGGGILLLFLLLRVKPGGTIDRDVEIFLKRLSPYSLLVEEYAQFYQIPQDLAKALIWTESSGRPNVKRWEGDEIGYSYGLTGVTYPAACDVGFRGKPEELLDPEVNVQFGLGYFRMWLNKAGENIPLALSCYNGGYGAFYYFLDKGRFLNPGYVEKTLKYYELLKERRI